LVVGLVVGLVGLVVVGLVVLVVVGAVVVLVVLVRALPRTTPVTGTATTR
jgi:hypothetical protein